MTDLRAWRALLDRFCPMHLCLDAGGQIAHVGPTLAKLRPGRTLPGQAFDQVFRLLRPEALSADLPLGVPLHLHFRAPPHTPLKGIASPAPGGIVVNLGFGIAVAEALRSYPLVARDFAPTDPTVEMLFLIEASSAAMAASRHLNLRLQGAKAAAEEQAQTDTLTGLRNLRALRETMAHLIGAGMRFALLHVDLDHFKAVNDSLGHAAGDHVLCEVARLFLSETRETDTVARIGGDEFLLVLPDLLDRARLARIAQRLVDGLERPIPFHDSLCRISGSIGVALSEDVVPPDAEALMRLADRALYAAKHAGRGRAVFAADLGPAPMSATPRSTAAAAPSPVR